MDMNSGFYRRLLDGLYDGVYFTDTDRRITYWNRGAERISGYCAADVVGTRCSDNVLMHVDEGGQELCRDLCPLAATMADGREREATVYLHHSEGHRLPVLVHTSPIYDDDGQVVGGVEQFSDNSAMIAMVGRLEELEELAMQDALTRLANRRYAEAALHSRLDELKRYGWPFAVLFADVDRFKSINDRYGHKVGDRVLTMVGRTLREGVRPFDTVARWGGEEFVCVLANVSAEQLARLAERLRVLVERCALSTEARMVHVTASFGGTLGRVSDGPEEMVHRADMLMLQSKETGRNRVTLDSRTG